MLSTLVLTRSCTLAHSWRNDRSTRLRYAVAVRHTDLLIRALFVRGVFDRGSPGVLSKEACNGVKPVSCSTVSSSTNDTLKTSYSLNEQAGLTVWLCGAP